MISYTVKYKRAFEASAALKDYFMQQIELRRSKPTEDIIGDLVTAEIDGEKLSDEAIYSFLRLLLPAGLETTYRSSGNLLYLLLTHPEQFQAVKGDHELITAAIEEGLRYETPLTTVQRYATEETEMEGVTLPQGAVIDVCIGSANRDEQRWERSEEFDIFRKRLPHTLCRRRTHVHRPSSRANGDAGRARVPAGPTEQHPTGHRRQSAHLRSTVPFADCDSGDVRRRRMMANTASAPTRRRRDRGSINVDEILYGAFEVAAQVSIDNLSMPLLAKHLDVGVTSIYWYFRRKDDLLNAMSDRALERFEFTAPSIDASNWRESLRNHARTMRQGSQRPDPV